MAEQSQSLKAWLRFPLRLWCRRRGHDVQGAKLTITRCEPRSVAPPGTLAITVCESYRECRRCCKRVYTYGYDLP